MQIFLTIHCPLLLFPDRFAAMSPVDVRIHGGSCLHTQVAITVEKVTHQNSMETIFADKNCAVAFVFDRVFVIKH
jgi:hypothetical protein